MVALRALGLAGKDIDWSHEPALELRAINEAGTDYDPPQHDPRFIEIRTRVEHKHITFTDNGTGRGDITAIAHRRKVTDAEQEFRRRMLVKDTGERPPRKSRWPKRPWPKRSKSQIAQRGRR
ncbi:MAG: hypothetical protein IT537_08660 [Hyphomicrobiales bacterium]|nr:hypothetical protein [Hyphomicrobiales bacterium]